MALARSDYYILMMEIQITGSLELIELIFWYLKYLLIILLIISGVILILKFRKKYLFQRDQGKKELQNQIGKGKLIVGIFYIFFGIGFLFNFLAYFLVVLLKPLPDSIIIYLVSELCGNSLMVRQIYENQILIVNYILEFGSLMSLISLFSSFYFLYDKSDRDQGKKIKFLLLSLLGCILFGFSSCFSLFLLH